MADGLELNAGSGGATLATDDAGVAGHVQIVKLAQSADASATPITADAGGLLVNLGTNNDVTVTGTVTVDGSGVTQPISAASLPLPTGAATAANQATIIGHVDGIEGLLTTIDSDTSNLANLHSADYDTGAGTDTTVAIGLAIPSNGGAVAVTSTNPLPIDLQLGSTQAAAGAGNSNANTLRVVVATDQAVIPISDNAGSLTVDGTITANLAAGTNTNEVVGDVAHDAAAAGNPVLVAASAETMADSAPANRVSADADATRLSATDGALFVIPTGPQTWSYHVNGSSALTDATVHAAPGAGLSLYVTDIVFSSGAATAINAFFEESTTTVLGPYYLEAVAGRGMAVHFGTPKKITANTALTVTTSAAIAHSIDVTGFIAPG